MKFINGISAGPARRATAVLLPGLVCAALIAALVHWASPVAAQAPKLTATEVVTGLDIPWGLAFTPDGTMLITERGGRISARLSDGSVQTVETDMTDFYANNELGLMGIVIDPSFAANRRFYTCQGHRDPQETQVIAWTISDDYTQARRVNNPLVGSIPAASIHNGCRLRFGADGYLYITTGDARIGTGPQDLNSLAGKILRVDAADGSAAPNNPFIESSNANAKLVYSYGHRNPQGLALRPGTSQMWSVEHGPSIDDEINLLVKGGNYGWDPVSAGSSGGRASYASEAPMTDTAKHPEAIEARYSTGNPTLAMSGGIFLVNGDTWGAAQDYLAVATLKDRTLYFFKFDADGRFLERMAPELSLETGASLDYRFRTPVIGPDEALYLATSNGGQQDVILRVVPDRPLAAAPAAESPSETPPDPRNEDEGSAADAAGNEASTQSDDYFVVVAGALLLLFVGAGVVFVVISRKKNRS